MRRRTIWYVGQHVQHCTFGVGRITALGYECGGTVVPIKGQVTCKFQPDAFGRDIKTEVRTKNLISLD